MGKSYRDRHPPEEGKLKPKTPNQSVYLTALENEMTTLVVGPPGTGKTYMAIMKAYEGLLVTRKFKKLVLCRPAKGTEDDLGFEPGTMNEKMEGWIRPLSEPLINVMGKEGYKTRVGNTIELVPLHQLMGRSFYNSFIIVDEAQNMSEATARSLVTRTGKHSKLVICGDIAQQTVPYNSGLSLLLDIVETDNLSVNIIDLTLDDCVRSEECLMWIKAFDRRGIV